MDEKISLDYNERKIIIDVLEFTLTACPVESIGDQIQITPDKVNELISKLRNTIE